mmetsp:Transcript_112964/g.205348  ORF Transcript_112964/g.205348 Transcript_112964/m.205348 type:complete len:533 (+) Transcript_112964:56-1654(+)
MGCGASTQKLQEAEARADKATADLKKQQAAADALKKANQDMEEELKKIKEAERLAKEAEGKVRKDADQLEKQLKAEKSDKAKAEDQVKKAEDQIKQEKTRSAQLEDQLNKEKSDHTKEQGMRESISRDLQVAEDRAKKEAAAMKEQHRQAAEEVGLKLRDAEAAAESARNFQREVESRELDLRGLLADAEKAHEAEKATFSQSAQEQVRLQGQIKQEYEEAMADAIQNSNHVNEVAERNNALISDLVSAMLVRGSELSVAEQAQTQSQVQQTELQLAEMEQARLQEEVNVAHAEMLRLSKDMQAMSSDMLCNLALAEQKHEALAAELSATQAARLGDESRKNREAALADGMIVCSSTFRQVALRDELDEAARAVKQATEISGETQAAEAALQSSFRDLQESYARVEADCEAALVRETEKVQKIRELTCKVQTAEDQQKALELQLAGAKAQVIPVHTGVQTDLPVNVSQQAMEKLAMDLRRAEMRQYNLEAELSAAWAEAEIRVYPGAISFCSSNASALRQANANFLWHPKII